LTGNVELKGEILAGTERRERLFVVRDEMEGTDFVTLLGRSLGFQQKLGAKSVDSVAILREAGDGIENQDHVLVQLQLVAGRAGDRVGLIEKLGGASPDPATQLEGRPTGGARSFPAPV
jgi:hypothetical protein